MCKEVNIGTDDSKTHEGGRGAGLSDSVRVDGHCVGLVNESLNMHLSLTVKGSETVIQPPVFHYYTAGFTMH